MFLKKLLIGFLFGVTAILFMCSCSSVKCNREIENDYSLVWADEFNYSGAPNPAYWQYEEGFVRNNEAQFYTLDRRKNVRVEDGCLVIEAHKENIEIEKILKATSKPIMRHNKDFKVAKYTSGSINTNHKVWFKYGRIDVRAKNPLGDGVWPAIWTLGKEKRWPACGEIDIMEYFYTNNKDVSTTNVHFSKNGKHNSAKRFLQNRGIIKIDKTKFHVYTLEWNPEKLSFYVDGKFVCDFDVKHAVENGFQPFNQPHYLLLNLAIGGGPNKIIDDKLFPHKYLIDYVRVYRKNNCDFELIIKK